MNRSSSHLRFPIRVIQLLIVLTGCFLQAEEPAYPDLRVGEDEILVLSPGLHEYNIVFALNGGEIRLTGDTEIIVHGEDYPIDMGEFGIVNFAAFFTWCNIVGEGENKPYRGSGSPDRSPLPGGDGHDLTIRVLNGSAWTAAMKLSGGDGGRGAISYPGGHGGNFSLHAKKGADVGSIEVNGGDARTSFSPGAPGGQGGNVFIFSGGYLQTVHITAYGGDGSDGASASFCGDIPAKGGDGAHGGNITLFCLDPYSAENGALEAQGGGGGQGGQGWSHCEVEDAPVDGADGGQGGDAGSIIIKAGDSFEYIFDSFGSIETQGGYGGLYGDPNAYWIHPEEEDSYHLPVPGAKRGGYGIPGNGGDITIVSPTITGIDSKSPVTYEGGTFGWYIEAKKGGKDGTLTLMEVEPRFFPQTGMLEPADPKVNVAEAGEDFELVYTFTNDMDVPVEAVDLETWRLNPNVCEPARTVDGSIIHPSPYGQYEVGEGRFRAEWPIEIAPGATIEWRFQVHIRDNLPLGDLSLDQQVTIRGEYESEVLEGVNEEGENLANFSIPCKQRLDVWVHSEKEAAGDGQTVVMNVLCTNNAQNAATGVEVELSDLHEALSWVGDPPIPLLIGTIPPESSIEHQFSIVVENPLRDPPPISFAFDSRIRSAESDWSEWMPGKPVSFGKLLLWPASPEGLYITRSNRVPSAGLILGAEDLELTPPDITALFTTQGTDTDTGALIIRDSNPLEILGDFSYDDSDSLRLVAWENQLIPSVNAGDIIGKGTHNLEANSIFYESVHYIFERSLPRAQFHGMGGGQRTELEIMKQLYPEFSKAISVKHTDMAERLHELNLLGATAMRTANQHFDDLVKGIHGVASVWDLLPIIGNLGSRYLKWGSRGVAGIVGFRFNNKVIKMGLETGIRADATNYLLKKIPLVGNPLFRLLKKRSIYRSAYKVLVSDSDSIQEGALKTIYFQLGSGELAETFIRNINHYNQPVGEYLSSDLRLDTKYDLDRLLNLEDAKLGKRDVDRLFKEVLEQGVPLGVEALIHAEHDYGQGRLLSLGFGGSQDAALAAGAIARSKLEHESHSAEGFEEAGEFGQKFFRSMSNVLMVAQFIPDKTAQNLARAGSYVTEGLSRYASAGQAWAAGMFIFSVVDIMSLGTESLVEGTLAIQEHSFPDYGLVHTGHYLAADSDPIIAPSDAMHKFSSPAGAAETMDADPAFMVAYTAIGSAASARDMDALADAHGVLSNLIEAALEEESRTLSRASLLHGDSLKGTPLSMTIVELSQAIEDYANAVGQVIQSRRDVLTSTWALALNLEEAASHDQLDACLASAREAEIKLEASRAVLLPIFDLVSPPDAPQITMVYYPQSVHVGETFDLRVEVASLTTSSELETVEIELWLPEDGSIESLDPLQPEIQIVEARGSYTWQLRVLEPDFYLNTPFLMLKDQYGEVVDFALLSILAEPAGAEGIITAGSGGTLTTGDGNIQFSITAGGSADLQIFLDQLWTVPLGIEGWAPVGDHHLSIQAFDAESEVFVAAPPTLTTVRMQYVPENIPPGHSPGSIRILYTPDGETWQILASTVNPGDRTVTTQISSFGRFAMGIPDTVPPLPPTGLEVDTSDGLVTLSWIASPSADVHGYGIRVRVGSDPARTVGAMTADETRYSMEPLDDLPHQFEVYAYDYASNPSSALEDFGDDFAPNRGRTIIGDSILSRLVPVIDRTSPGGRGEYVLDLLNVSGDPVELTLTAQGPELTEVELTSSSIVLRERSTVGLEILVGESAALGEQIITVKMESASGKVFTASALFTVEDWTETGSVASVQSGGSVVSVSGSPSDDLYSLDGLIDGSSLSGWRSALYETGPLSIVIELAGGEIFDVNGIRLDLTPLMPEADTTMAPADLSVLVSNRGWADDDFTTVGTWSIPAGVLEFETALGPVEARYVKLIFATNQGSIRHLEVAEVEIRGGRRDLPLNFGALRDHLLNRRSLSNEELMPYDLNGDGRIDVSDLILLLEDPK